MFWVGMRAERVCGEVAVDSQHGTSLEGSLHPCTKGYHPREELFIFALITTDLSVIHVCTANMFFMLFIFFSSGG
jgi:hypothetical protein